MDYINSLVNVIQAIDTNNKKTVAGKSKLSIIVENRYEIFITHYPLWSNEQFLYSIGCVLNKIILEKNIPEEMVYEKFSEIKTKDNSQVKNHRFILN